jgi:hypothetical protein
MYTLSKCFVKLLICSSNSLLFFIVTEFQAVEPPKPTKKFNNGGENEKHASLYDPQNLNDEERKVRANLFSI